MAGRTKTDQNIPASGIRFDAITTTPCCCLGVVSAGGKYIDEIVFLPPDTPCKDPVNALAAKAVSQLQAFFANPASPFDLPLAIRGTAFQQSVWRQIAAIPLGSVTHYGDISARMGSAARAVGQACGANPFPLIVPCHRVISRQGLGGFAHAREGWLLNTKRWLLAHEGVI